MSDLQQLLDLANDFIEKGDYKFAIVCYNKAILKCQYDYEEKARITLMEGKAYLAIGNNEKAIEDFNYAAKKGNKEAIEILKKLSINNTPQKPSSQSSDSSPAPKPAPSVKIGNDGTINRTSAPASVAPVVKQKSEVTVLLITDDLVMRNFISKNIENTNGIKIVEKVNNIKEAFIKAQQLNPDIICLDLNSLRNNAINFLNEFKTKGMTIPVITIFPHYKKLEEVRNELMPLGVKDVIKRPVDATSSEGRVFIEQLMKMLLQ